MAHILTTTQVLKSLLKSPEARDVHTRIGAGADHVVILLLVYDELVRARYQHEKAYAYLDQEPDHKPIAPSKLRLFKLEQRVTALELQPVAASLAKRISALEQSSTDQADHDHLLARIEDLERRVTALDDPTAKG
jgi:hypothetical protein